MLSSHNSVQRKEGAYMMGANHKWVETTPQTTQMQLRLDNGPAAFLDLLSDATGQRRSVIVGHIIRWARRKGVEKHLVNLFSE